jgi:hypothetical protein
MVRKVTGFLGEIEDFGGYGGFLALGCTLVVMEHFGIY